MRGMCLARVPTRPLTWHPAHSNALRQARAMGTHLVVGLISDDEITKAKGSPPVMPYEERVISLKACKFVDEVIPYVPSQRCAVSLSAFSD